MKALVFEQSKIKMYITTMNIEELVENSFVAHYDSQTGEDYQRPPVPSHYRKIAQYFINDANAFSSFGIKISFLKFFIKYSRGN